MNVSYRNAIRLARTETNFTANQAMIKTYKRAKVEKYQILATLDSRTSEICQDMDGYIGELKNARVGENYPPFHPNCRTTTVPYLKMMKKRKELLGMMRAKIIIRKICHTLPGFPAPELKTRACLM